MTVQSQGGGGGITQGSSGLADVINTILDKGLVIDAFVNVSLLGIDILTINARVVVASVDTYLRFAEAAGRLEIQSGEGLADILHDTEGKGAKAKVHGAATGALEAAGERLSAYAQQHREEESEQVPARRRSRRRDDE